MKWNTIASVALWTLVAGVLVFFFGGYAKGFMLPGVVLLVPAVAIIVYYVVRRGQRSKKTSDLVLGRFAPAELTMAGAVMFILAIAWIVFFASSVQNDADELLFAVVVPVLAMIALAGLLISIGIYYTIKRN